MKKLKLDIQRFVGRTYINGSSTASNCDCRIEWYSTGDTSTNSSSVTANVQIYRNGSSSTTGTFSGSLTINGTKYSISKKFSPYNWGSWATVGSKTVTIEHDADGTKTIPIKCSVSNTGTSMAGTYSASGNATLDTLHKAPTINSITMQEVNPTLVQAGISNNYFVLGLSQKQFTINANYEDSATYDHTTIINQYGTIGADIWHTSLSTQNIDVLNTTNNILDTKTNNLEILTDNTQTPTTMKISLNYVVYDSMGGGTKYSDDYTTYNYQTYTPITLTASVKRAGQTSGNVKITASGTYYNRTIGNENHSGTYKPTLIYKYWEAGQDETQATIVTIPSSSITTSYGTYSCEYQVSNFDYEKAYRFKVAVQDTLNNNSSMWFSSAISDELSIAVGKALWTEYKDRVDFAKLTINGTEIIPKNIITLKLSGNQSMTGTSANLIKVNTIDTQVGDKFTLDTTTYKVTIGSGINHILVSCNGIVNTYSTNGLRRMLIRKNSTDVARGMSYYSQNFNNSICITPRLISVSEGDKIDFVMVNAGNTTLYGSDIDTWFTIEAVD